MTARLPDKEGFDEPGIELHRDIFYRVKEF
jgi:hypothetical protein